MSLGLFALRTADRCDIGGLLYIVRPVVESGATFAGHGIDAETELRDDHDLVANGGKKVQGSKACNHC